MLLNASDVDWNAMIKVDTHVAIEFKVSLTWVDDIDDWKTEVVSTALCNCCRKMKASAVHSQWLYLFSHLDCTLLNQI